MIQSHPAAHRIDVTARITNQKQKHLDSRRLHLLPAGCSSSVSRLPHHATAQWCAQKPSNMLTPDPARVLWLWYTDHMMRCSRARCKRCRFIYGTYEAFDYTHSQSPPTDRPTNWLWQTANSFFFAVYGRWSAWGITDCDPCWCWTNIMRPGRDLRTAFFMFYRNEITVLL